ncbi:30S ribosomal protein S20 [Candidatus Saccharibacteria bacterium]|nr:30S ribosomal protein S20 [Candidatus Saccharibacteria bacterium]
MPIIKSAIKRDRQAKKRNQRNVAVKVAVKKKFKVVRTEILSGSPKDSKALIAAIAEVDRAVKKGVLHKGTAARRKSRLTKAYNAAAAKPFGTESAGQRTGKPGAKKATAKKPAAKTTAKKAPAKKPAAKPNK